MGGGVGGGVACGRVDVENGNDSKPHVSVYLFCGQFGFDVADDWGEDREAPLSTFHMPA